MIRVMVAIRLFQGLDGHPGEACDFPLVGSGLHKPRYGGVTEGMSHNALPAQSSALYRRKVKATGVLPSEAPLKPPAPRL